MSESNGRNEDGTFAEGNAFGNGGPTDYDPDFCERARKICLLLGATDDELAEIFGVCRSTLYKWKRDHPEFREAIAAGKLVPDSNVAERLYRRAMGYSHPDVHITNYQGEITETPITKHYPPDTMAGMYWLNNRQPGRWKNRQNAEHSGPNGGPIPVQDVTDPLEQARRVAFLLALGLHATKPTPPA